MDFLEILNKRQSIRSYSDQPVAKCDLDYILECARLAPSAVNKQPLIFIVISSDESIDKIRSCYGKPWFSEAPQYIMVCCDHDQSWKRPFDGKDHGDVDAAIAAEHICIAAAEKGIGTCWVCNFDAKKCAQLFDLPGNIEPIALFPIGYQRDVEPKEKLRKDIKEVVFHNAFNRQ